MDLKDIQALLVNQSKTWFPEVWEQPIEERIQYNTIALCGEVGEAANEVKKWMRGDDHSQKHLEAVPEELADVLAYALILAENLGCDLEEELLLKMRKNQERFHS